MHTSIVGMQPAQFVTMSSIPQAGNVGGGYGINQLSDDFDTKSECNMTFSHIHSKKIGLKVTFKTYNSQFCMDKINNTIIMI